MNKFVTIVYDDYEGYVVAIYLNADDADQDYPWSYKETKYLNTSVRTQTPEKGKTYGGGEGPY